MDGLPKLGRRPATGALRVFSLLFALAIFASGRAAVGQTLLAPPGEPRNGPRGAASFFQEATVPGGVTRLPSVIYRTSMYQPPIPPQERAPLETPEGYTIPVTPPAGAGEVKVERSGKLLSVVARDVSIAQVISEIAEMEKLNVVFCQNIEAKVSICLHNVSAEDAFTAILLTAGYTWVQKDNIIHITSIAAPSTLPPEVQGRKVEIFSLDYISATEVEKVIKGMLSPVGHSSVIQNTPTDLRKSQDLIIVEDLPGYLDRIREYVARMDQPPREVLIEAHVLSVSLGNDLKHGVNWKNIFSIANNEVNLKVTGFANPVAPEAFLATISGGNLDTVVELLQTTTNAKTLASPKALVINGQEAKIQVGKQIAYKLATTTQTSTMESVNFLDTGVVLTITPYISRDNMVLLKVKPEVSSAGPPRSDDLPPDKDTTQVETNILVADGQGIVIGGLIDEKDKNVQGKIPFLGDLWLVGFLFQHRTVEKERNEIIITLLPRILPYAGCDAVAHDTEVSRAGTPLVRDGLITNARPWEPGLPDAANNPFRNRESAAAIASNGSGPCPACPSSPQPPMVSLGPEIAPQASPQAAPPGQPGLSPQAEHSIMIPTGPLEAERRPDGDPPVNLR